MIRLYGRAFTSIYIFERYIPIIPKDKIITPVLVGDNNGVPRHSCQFASLPKIYIQNASLEIAKTSVIFEKNSIAGDTIMPFITEGYEGFDLNHHYDWVYVKYLIKPYDYMDLSKNIEYLANNQDERTNYGNYLRKRCEQKYSIEAVSSKYINSYRRVLK